MNNMLGGNYRVVLPTLAKVSRALAHQHLNHERRRERMETLNRMIEIQSKYSMTTDPVYSDWLHVLHLILFATVYEDLTHSEVKGALHFFAEMCDAALAELTKPKEDLRLT